MKLRVINSCDGCTACCKIMGVHELGKPYYYECQHKIKGACGIYEDRPES